jgi:hypothetical protein
MKAATICSILAGASVLSTSAAFVLEGTAKRTVFNDKGTVLAQISSQFTCTFDDNASFIDWHRDDGREHQSYYLTPTLQQGTLSAPLAVKDGATYREVGSNVTSVVLAKGFRPRGAQTDVKLLAFALMDSNRFESVVTGGFLAPWGNDMDVFAQSCRVNATFRQAPPYLIDKAQLLWDSPRWTNYVTRRDPNSPALQKKPLANDGDVVGTFEVADWLAADGSSLPKKWRFERFSVGTAKRYTVEVAEFDVTQHRTAAPSLTAPPHIPGVMTVNDYRAASPSNTELKFVWLGTNSAWLSEASPEFVKRTERAVHEREPMLKRRWQNPTSQIASPRTNPNTTTKRTIMLISIILTIGIIPILLLVGQIRNKQITKQERNE